ncbi:YihY/virulence factor BrkB family protein [Mucilaginibacter antarcticus]
MLQNRFLSFSLIVSLGFLLLVSLVLNFLMNALSERVVHFLPYVTNLIIKGINLGITLIVISTLFAIIFKVLPDVKIRWKDVRSGAIFTAMLFMLGQYGIAIYLQYEAQSSAYGAAGSIILILLWIYYTAAILYIGAEFTQVYAEAVGCKIQPADYAVAVVQTEVEREVTTLPPQHPDIKGKLETPEDTKKK